MAGEFAAFDAPVADDFSAFNAPIAGAEAPAQPAPSALETGLYNASNVFGVGPALSAILHTGHVSGPEYEGHRDAYRNLYERGNEEHTVAKWIGKAGGLAAETVLGGGVGKLIGAGAKAANVGQNIARESPVLRTVLKGALGGGAYGAAAGAGEALSTGRDVLPAAATGAAIGGVAGGAIGGIAGGLGKLLKKAPAMRRADQLEGIAQGTGEHGSATPTMKKRLANDEQDVLNLLGKDREMGHVVDKPAKIALPVVERKVEALGAELKPLYALKDRETGGTSLAGLADYLTHEANQLRGVPLHETHVRALEQVRDSALKAWGGPELAAKMRGAANLERLGVEGPQSLLKADVMVPTQEVRAMVTRLQARGSDVINSLTPNESSVMKREIAGAAKGFLDADLDAWAERSGEKALEAVTKIREVNRDISAAINIRNAIEHRGAKEVTGTTTALGHGLKAIPAFGALAAIPSLMTGHFGAAAAEIGGALLLPQLPKLARRTVAMLATLETSARAGNPRAVRVLAAVQAARRAGTAEGGDVGGMRAGSLGQLEAATQ